MTKCCELWKSSWECDSVTMWYVTCDMWCITPEKSHTLATTIKLTFWVNLISQDQRLWFCKNCPPQWKSWRQTVIISVIFAWTSRCTLWPNDWQPRQPPTESSLSEIRQTINHHIVITNMVIHRRCHHHQQNLTESSKLWDQNHHHCVQLPSPDSGRK